MPKYAYRCCSCEHAFEQVHSMAVLLEDCHECDSPGTLIKIPSLITVIDHYSPSTQDGKPGDLVNQHIEEARQEIKEEQEEMTQDYKP